MQKQETVGVGGPNGTLPSHIYDVRTPTAKSRYKDLIEYHIFHLQGSAQIGGSIPNLKEVAQKLRLGGFRRENVSNLSKDDDSEERLFFDTGLRLMLSYLHEVASHCFLKCLQLNPNVVLAYGLVALCHSPNYNFKGEAYYESAYHFEDACKLDEDCVFPSQLVADRHSTAGVAIVEDIRRQRKKKGKRGKGRTKDNDNNHNEEGPTVLDVEAQFLAAVRILTGSPGIASDLSEEAVGRPYADVMRKIHQKFPNDSDMSYFFAESLMVLNAWKLYEYPSGKPLSADVPEIQATLERTLELNPSHPGLCHMYVHLSEMSDNPRQALAASDHLRHDLHHAGHLLHMPTHIDVLIGNYDQTIHTNCIAIAADGEIRELCPKTAGLQSFYFGYIVHNYHMAVYGGILGAMEQKSMEIANALNTILSEEMFTEHPSLVSYLEAYASLEVHVMVRFGRWEDILTIPLPKDKNLMLYRTASLLYARSLAFAMTGNITEALREADRFDNLRRHHPEADMRILHNNSVSKLLELDSVMLRGELLYRQGKYLQGLSMLRKAVTMQDKLNYDEPWGKMQPIRHALGGLLLEQNEVDEAIAVFRLDLAQHPRNPWALVGLIRALETKQCCSSEIKVLRQQLSSQRESEWADFDVQVPCACCSHAAV